MAESGSSWYLTMDSGSISITPAPHWAMGLLLVELNPAAPTEHLKKHIMKHLTLCIWSLCSLNEQLTRKVITGAVIASNQWLNQLHSVSSCNEVSDPILRIGTNNSIHPHESSKLVTFRVNWWMCDAAAKWTCFQSSIMWALMWALRGIWQDLPLSKTASMCDEFARSEIDGGK